LKRWRHGQAIKPFFNRGAPTRCPHGARTPKRAPLRETLAQYALGDDDGEAVSVVYTGDELKRRFETLSRVAFNRFKALLRA
jgi:hypothetical protein